jgi:hypothetical protein
MPNNPCIGAAAREALVVGGTKNIAWLDIDIFDLQAVNEWMATQRLIPRSSMKRIDSTTGKSHIYIVTDVPLRLRWQPGLKKLIKSSMPESLSKFVDRVYGPESCRVIFLPKLNVLEATLPQTIVSDISEAWKLPIEDIEDERSRVKSKIEEEAIKKQQWWEVDPFTLAAYVDKPWGGAFWLWLHSPKGDKWQTSAAGGEFYEFMNIRYGDFDEFPIPDSIEMTTDKHGRHYRTK